VTLAFGDYEQSYPPEILRGYAAPVLSGAAARTAPPEEGDEMEPTTPPPNVGPESNSPEGAVPVDSTRTEPDGPAVVAVPVDQLDETAAEAEPTPTVRAATAVEVETGETVGAELVDQPDADTVIEGTNNGDEAPDTGATRTAPSSPAGDETATRFVVSPGKPGTYDPEVPARDRPRNVTELREVARPNEPEPWLEGEYVLVGTTGKRAHWSGSDWHSDESPGYDVSDDSLDDEAEETPDADE
jgi:hypothetical protein